MGVTGERKWPKLIQNLVGGLLLISEKWYYYTENTGI